MIDEKIKEFAKSIKNEKVEEAETVLNQIKKDRREGLSEKLEQVEGINSQVIQELQMRGYNTLDKLADAPLEKLVKVPGLDKGKAKDILKSAKNHIVNSLKKLPGVGEDTAVELLTRGYTSLSDLAKSTPEDLTEIPNIGDKGAKEIIKYAETESITKLEDLPGVGKETAEEMKKKGFNSMNAITESSVEKLTKIPNIGERGASKIIEYAREHPNAKVGDLPGVGRETAKEIEKHGYTALRYVAESTVDELTETPNIGDKGARKILKNARERIGGDIRELKNIDSDTAEEIEKHGFRFIEDIASSSVEELIKIPCLREGKAKKLSKSAEKIIEKSNAGGSGYIKALEGILNGLDSNHELTLSQEISENKHSEKKLENIRERMKERSSQEFRPAEERSYNEAWVEVITAIIELKRSEGN
ncbi:MAG: helix-hairpin-helix domain-containing protein [Candidatus Hadarchaeia archaeon]